MKPTIEVLLLLPLLALVLGSLLNLSSHPHWFIRGWDFPRVQIIMIGWFLTGGFALWCYFAGPPSLVGKWWFIIPATALTLWHGFRIVPYTPVFPRQAKSTAAVDQHHHRADPRTIRVVVSNVEEENDQFARWRNTVTDANPDILVVLEADQRWVQAANPLFDRYPYRVLYPQDNWYGMMMLSRLPIVDHDIRFLVQDDIPSIDAMVQLDDCETIRFVAVHPRPPEPWRGNNATARDAELTIWGQELADVTGPTIIGGDLNDVAWSATTRLFLRTSGMLDPRRGRGFFNTFHADHWFLRYPLDHIFHSPHFTVSEIHRLPNIGSDHFPMLIDLRLEPWQKDEHTVLEEKAGDEEEVDIRVERARENKKNNGDAVQREPENAIRDW
ncbi:hypothetical protein LF1_11690 [Rubripirellula obstinata]|uniref:Endonuclease/exonuclease/phosphatase domain-containing protein n=1 Tax=Rubripirellula obstinata TaxID=406547 RepID=A0A5B1CBZ4_9BACT|nr:endonuclease/exonuclease/phosphatase family protein [Rubripirellula obstinata]KAA1258647.1 hypothetical protein LF1_11690 [Rubripirellula obstinata]